MKVFNLSKSSAHSEVLRLHASGGRLFFASLLLVHRVAHVARGAGSDDLGPKVRVEVSRDVARSLEHFSAVVGLSLSVAAASGVHGTLKALGVERNVLHVLRAKVRFNNNAV